jgi:hypothetical protein
MIFSQKEKQTKILIAQTLNCNTRVHTVPVQYVNMKELTRFEKSAGKRSRKSRKEATKNSIPPSSVADLDPISGAYSTPGSGMNKKSGSRSGDPDPG